MAEDPKTEITSQHKHGRSGRQMKSSKIRQNRFLKHYAGGATLTESFEVSGLGRGGYRYLRDNDEAFAARLEIAENASTDLLINEARRRAVEGVSESTGWYKGRAGGAVQRYSDNLLMFLLKQRDPSFKDKWEITGAGGQPLQIQVAAYTPPPAPQKGYESPTLPGKREEQPKTGPDAAPIEVEVDRGDAPK